jgi:hypothetical protein
MKQLDRSVYLMHLQPRIKEMLEIINGLLPHWISASQEELENYVDAMQSPLPLFSPFTTVIKFLVK